MKISGTERDGEPSSREWTPALFTDLYELTMLRAYWELGLEATAVFSLFVRRLPPERNFLVACGLDDLVAKIETLRFGVDDIAYLRAQGFPEEFLARLAGFRFEGDIYGVAEGTPVFANEPILEVVASIGQAQLLETLVINQVGFQTLIASKAARVAGAAEGRGVVDFGSRRAHGIDAGVSGARAAFVGGVEATSNVLAGKTFGIPIAGTMAHSFVQVFADEMEAFRAFAKVFPDTVLLVDTYDTAEGVEKVIALARELGPDFGVRAIRIDSGDLAALSKQARTLLDRAGLERVGIFASGGLDEWRIAALIGDGAPIDGFGVGTDMIVSADAPALDIVYKLTEFAGEGRIKLSAGKQTLPGRKQVFRTFVNGTAAGDVIGRAGEQLPGTPLLAPVMKDGRRVRPADPLADVQRRCRKEIAGLPRDLRALADRTPYPVVISPALDAEAQRIRRRFEGRQKKA